MNTEQRTLDCGHVPSPHAEFTTGTAHTLDGREICYECSNAMEREEFAKANKFTAYLSMDGSQVQTWPGGNLAKVTRRWNRQNNFAGTLVHFNAVASDGARWWGTSPGLGMYCRLHRCKD